MYTNVWSRYLPIIRIVLKRSIASEQVLALNISDFERVGLTRKSGYKFSIKFKNGRPEDVIIDFPLASSLVSTMLEDNATKEILSNNNFQISLSSKFELTIKHIEQLQPVSEEVE